MSLAEKIRAKARQRRTTIVLPEGDEPRTVAAADIVNTIAMTVVQAQI